MFMRALAIGLTASLAGACAAFAQAPTHSLSQAPAKEAFAGQTSAVPITTLGCNDSTFAQLPGHRDLFLSRLQPGCTHGGAWAKGGAWQIVLDRFDWSAHTFKLVRTLIPTPVQIAGAPLKSAYDPYGASYNGVTWIAFECVLANRNGASTCLAPMDPTTMAVDPSRAYPVVLDQTNAEGDETSASDPKLFSYNGRFYIYWTTVEIQKKKWVGIATRGAELTQGPNGLWPKGSGGRAIAANDTNLSVEVWGHADMFSIIQHGDQIYATAGRAEGACVSPDKEDAGCFQMLIARSSSPLGSDVFNRDLAPTSRLPTTSQEYARFASAPNGQLVIFGHFVSHKSGWFAQRPLATGPGVAAFPIDLDALFAP